MNRQAIIERCRQAVTAVRARFPLRRVLGLTLALGIFGGFAIVVEAIGRGRLDPPENRVPTAMYTRPTPWGEGRDRRTPIAIGTLDGSPMESRIPLRLTAIPDHLVQAVLAVEDQRFYGHHGLDLLRIGGALVANVKAGAIVQGGSTVTQQLAKNLFLTARRTPLRKIREAAFAVVLEARYDKRRILEAYLNEIYLGQDADRAIHGVGAGARYYFGKSAENLSLAESATLAGMIRAPNRTTPTRHVVASRDRRNLVLRLMAEQKRISTTVADRASRSRLAGRARPAAVLESRHFRDFALKTPPGGMPARGMAVFTTLDASLQLAAERAVQSHLDRINARWLEAALVAIDPRTGEVLAMVGGRNYGTSQFNRATDARRQPGSAFKPVVALAALDRWEGRSPDFTLASLIDDEPLRVRTPQGTWEPNNYDGGFRGPVTLRHAMEQSLNVPFARVGLAVGAKRIVATARRLGIAGPLDAVPSLALGSSEVTLLELVRAYGVLAAAGRLAPTRTYAGEGGIGEAVLEYPAGQASQVFDPAVAYLVTSSLEGVISRGTGRAFNQGQYWEGIAGKTGTSNDWRDAWFVAYSPTLVVGAWVGFDDARSLGMTGGTAALPMVRGFLREAPAAVRGESFEVPSGITEGYMEIAAGGWGSECGAREVFLEGTEPEGNACHWSESPRWEPMRELGRELERRARRYFQDLMAERLERRGPRR